MVQKSFRIISKNMNVTKKNPKRNTKKRNKVEKSSMNVDKCQKKELGANNLKSLKFFFVHSI